MSELIFPHTLTEATPGDNSTQHSPASPRIIAQPQTTPHSTTPVASHCPPPSLGPPGDFLPADSTETLDVKSELLLDTDSSSLQYTSSETSHTTNDEENSYSEELQDTVQQKASDGPETKPELRDERDGRASIYMQRKELKELLMQDLANFRLGRRYLLAKELEEKLAALRLHKSILHRFKILQYLHLRDKQVVNLHPAVLHDMDGSHSLDRKRLRNRHGYRGGTRRSHSFHCDDQSFQTLTPIPEEDDNRRTSDGPDEGNEQILNFENQENKTFDFSFTDQERNRKPVPEDNGQSGTIDSEGQTGSPLRSRKFLKKNKISLSESPFFSSDCDLQASDTSGQCLTSSTGDETDCSVPTSEGNIVRVEVNTVNSERDSSFSSDDKPATADKQDDEAYPSRECEHYIATYTQDDGMVPTLPTGGSHSMSSPDTVSTTLQTLTNGCLDISMARECVAPESNMPSTLADTNVREASRESHSQDVVIEAHNLPDSTKTCLPCPSPRQSPGVGRTLPPLITSGPTDYLTWAAEVARLDNR